MQKWNLKVNGTPKEIGEKLKITFENKKGFAFNSTNDYPLKFKIRKRALVALDGNTLNRIIVKGKILKATKGKNTDMEISFGHHPLWSVVLFGHIFLGLAFIAAMILKFSNDFYFYFIGGILLLIGILVWLHGQKQFDARVSEYKQLIAAHFELRN
ncbi:DUF423 domain-containing protein [Christiangramia sabulilitoris]|uniref:DUF423 domain-containing protein n=1 Tax=Christiangramia sabulilitoris TaxID=2583991 RepID=A0A550I793_9FLAO|nr:DUF423 domain-containing protein [Christiangramia sabulilitoris]TRO66840.1 DUF423 domain-containing protein [Christiangramia sabulilitoris]